MRENNQVTNQTVTYEYDVWGNILDKKIYAYTTTDDLTGLTYTLVPYAYTNTAWGDQLTSYNGQAITYDNMGNPTSYRGYTFGWRGKQLTSASNGTNSLTFEYNEDGLRQKKTVDNVDTDYFYNGSVLIGMLRGQSKFLFSYDANGNVVSVDFNGTEYYYLRNAQGDIVKLIDSTGATKVEYTYDTWGKKVSTTGDLADTLGLLQPFRYRGYVYDWETGFYYVSSRYYDPEIGRWINSDNMITTGSDLAGLNLFAYCGNNPVNRVDPSGRFWISAIIKTVVVVAATIAKVVYTVKETKRVQEELDTLPEPTADISESFRKTLRDNANTVKETTKNKGIIESGKQFYNKVRNKGEWDLKQLPEYQGTFRLIIWSFRGKILEISTLVTLVKHLDCRIQFCWLVQVLHKSRQEHPIFRLLWLPMAMIFATKYI